MNVDHLIKAQKLMAQAMACASNSMSNNTKVSEAKGHMRMAIGKLEEATRKVQLRKKPDVEPQKAFANQASTVKQPTAANTKVAQEAYMRTLDMLNAMIAEEKDNLANLENVVQEKAAQEKTKKSDLFHD